CLRANSLARILFSSLAKRPSWTAYRIAATVSLSGLHLRQCTMPSALGSPQLTHCPSDLRLAVRSFVLLLRLARHLSQQVRSATGGAFPHFAQTPAALRSA